MNPRLKGLFALSLLISLIGTGLAWHEWDELKLANKAAAEPTDVDLAKVEAGERPQNLHIKIGSHYSCYYSTVYNHRREKGHFFERPDANTAITYAFYPIISLANPDAQLLGSLEKTYGDLGKVPKNVDFPEPTKFLVLVKTARFHKVGDVPYTPILKDGSIEGLVVNEVSPLTSQEKKLIEDSFPDADFTKVLILEEGRTPSSTQWSFCWLVVGLVVVGIGLLVLLRAIYVAVLARSASA